MRRYYFVFVVVLAGLLSSCRAIQQKAAPFDPLSLGQPGGTLKAFLDRQGQQRPGQRATVSRVTIEASLVGMNRKGKMVAEKTVEANGHISYEMKSFEGDNLVKTKVIALYLGAEQDASETTPPAINSENYRFKFKRKDSLGDRIAMIFELTPVRKMIGLFKGELWLEENTGWELRQSGRLVKNPSVIFKTADLTRDFALHRGAPYLSAVDYQAETRVVGRITLKMNFEPPEPVGESR
jgi:hypothetical protein